MNKQPSLEALRARAEQTASFARNRRRATTAVAAVAMLGVSMTACSSGANGADAASADSTVVDGSTPAEAGATTDTATAGGAAESGPQFSTNGGPPMGAPGIGGPGGAGGTVTAIDGSTITVENQGRDGTTTTLTVETDDDTTVSTTLEGSIDDLAVGDTIVAFGETSDDEFVASSINEGMGAIGGPVFQGNGTPGADGQPPVFIDGAAPDGSIPAPPDAPTSGQLGGPDGGPGGRAGGPMAGQLVTGTITEIGDSTITVETNDGVETVINVDDDTTITVAVDKELSDIDVGSTIRVSGDNTDDTIAATSIVITSD